MKKYLISSLKPAAAFLSLSLLFVACTNDKGQPQEPNNKDAAESNFAELSLPFAPGMTRAVGEPGVTPPNIPPLSPIEPPAEGTAVIDAIYDNIHGIIINQKKVYNAGFAFDQMSIFNPAGNQIYPGSVFVGSSITNGKFLNLKSTVGNITWAANGLYPQNPADNYVRTIVDPKSSDYNGTMQAWGSIPSLPIAATTTFEVNEVSSSKEIGIQIGIGYDSDDLKAKLNLSGKHEKMKTHVLVKAVQKAFSVALDVPNSKSSILKTADVADMDGVMPVYVSEVFYGRLGYAVISSNHEYHEVVAALNLNIPTEKIDIEISTKYKEILDASVSKSYLIGGTSEEHGLGLSNGWDGFKKALSAPLTPFSAKPIAYTLRYVNDNSVARVVLTSDYVLNESYFIPDMDEVKISLQPVSARAKAGARKPLSLYGDITAKLDIPGAKTQTIFSRSMYNYVRLEDGETTASLRDEAPSELIIKRPAGMSMKQLLATKVTINAHFYNADINGRVQLDDLGSKTMDMTVRDLIFGALRGTMNVYTKRNHYGEFEANILIEPTLESKNIKRLGNKYSY